MVGMVWIPGQGIMIPHATSLSRIGEGNGSPLQYSCLENPRDGGAWLASIYGVAQSQTRLKRLSSSSSMLRKAVKDKKNKTNKTTPQTNNTPPQKKHHQKGCLITGAATSSHIRRLVMFTQKLELPCTALQLNK